MFEYILLVEFTAELNGKKFMIEATQVAKYKVNLGLEPNDIIKLDDISVFGEDRASYTGRVRKKEKFIKQHEKRDIFGIYVFVEVANKESFEKIRDFLKEQHPDKF
jgi:hypothetical protein